MVGGEVVEERGEDVAAERVEAWRRCGGFGLLVFRLVFGFVYRLIGG